MFLRGEMMPQGRECFARGKSGTGLHLNQEHTHGSFCENAVRQHGRHIDEGAGLSCHRIFTQLNVGLAFKEIQDGGCGR